MINFFMIANWVLFILVIWMVRRGSQVENKTRNTWITVVIYPLILYLVALGILDNHNNFESYLYVFWYGPWLAQ